MLTYWGIKNFCGWNIITHQDDAFLWQKFCSWVNILGFQIFFRRFSQKWPLWGVPCRVPSCYPSISQRITSRWPKKIGSRLPWGGANWPPVAPPLKALFRSPSPSIFSKKTQFFGSRLMYLKALCNFYYTLQIHIK